MCGDNAAYSLSTQRCSHAPTLHWSSSVGTGGRHAPQRAGVIVGMRTPAAAEQIIVDIDATDDPLHRHQEGPFFHGYYEGYCYLPLYVFCGWHRLAAKLRRSKNRRDGGIGAVRLARSSVRRLFTGHGTLRSEILDLGTGVRVTLAGPPAAMSLLRNPAPLDILCSRTAYLPQTDQ
jgi:hypothetical protein